MTLSPHLSVTCQKCVRVTPEVVTTVIKPFNHYRALRVGHPMPCVSKVSVSETVYTILGIYPPDHNPPTFRTRIPWPSPPYSLVRCFAMCYGFGNRTLVSPPFRDCQNKPQFRHNEELRMRLVRRRLVGAFCFGVVDEVGIASSIILWATRVPFGSVVLDRARRSVGS